MLGRAGAYTDTGVLRWNSVTGELSTDGGPFVRFGTGRFDKTR